MIPRGIEILVKKASIDAAFCEMLLTKRAAAAAQIGLELNPAETVMFEGIPESQLIGIISNTRVSPKARPVFMGYAAAAMLAALGVVTGCGTSGEEAVPEETAPSVADEPPAETGENTLDMLGTDSDDTTDELGLSGEGAGGGFGEVTGGGSGIYKGTGATGIRPDSDFVKEENAKVSFSINSVAGPGESDPSRSRAAISAKINARKSGIFYFFRKKMKEYPEIPGGKIVYEITIIANGSVSDVEVLDDGIMNTSLTVDIASRISSWHFPRASGDVTVVVPFVFVVTE